MHEEYHRWWTPHLSRDFEMLVVGHTGYPLILFPTSLGRYYQYKDFGLTGSVRSFVEAGLVRLYLPDGIDGESWYNQSIHPIDRARTHDAYDRVIRHDVVPRAQVGTRRHHVGVAGASFGGYHAVNFALRHPDVTGLCISLSGAFDIRQFVDGHAGEIIYFHNPAEYLPGLNDAWFLAHLRRMRIILGTGEWDACRDANFHLSRLLGQKGVPHWLDDRKWCGHDWNYWRDMFPYYLSTLV